MYVQEHLVQKYAIILSFAFRLGTSIAPYWIVSMEYGHYVWILKPEDVEVF